MKVLIRQLFTVSHFFGKSNIIPTLYIFTNCTLNFGLKFTHYLLTKRTIDALILFLDEFKDKNFIGMSDIPC